MPKGALATAVVVSLFALLLPARTAWAAPPTVAALIAPSNGGTGLGTSPTLDVMVTDSDSDLMTVTLYGRPFASGVFRPIANSTNVASGARASGIWSNIGAGQKYEWYATVSDGSSTTTGPTWTFSTAAGPDPVFVGAGDIARCESTGDEATAAIVEGIEGTVFTLGDNAYVNGTAAEFTDCYDPSWGAVKHRTRPIPGNHDWYTANLAGYRGYFGSAATDAGGKSYYSYDIAGSNWHVVNLDSECAAVLGGCGVGSPQELWLRADLAANSTKHVIALWHKPRYSSGKTPSSPEVQPFVEALYEYGADLVLVGHDHVYERHAPLDPIGEPDASYGLRTFTVGTGGSSRQAISTVLPTSEVLNNDTYGVMKLTLHANSYDWEFFPEAGKTFTDSGTASVHGAPGSSPPTASAPSDFNADGRSDLLWRNSATGENYLWFMDGTTLGSSGPTLTLADQAWRVAETGDFDGDSNADIAWQNASTGQVYVWLMDGTTLASHGAVFTLTDPDWKLVGSGDYDGDSKDDLLWRNATTGENYVWFMNGTTLASSGPTLTLSDLAWKVVGTGDYDGDATADIAWQNTSTGQVYVWLMNGTTLSSHGAVFTLADPNWKVQGSGDYDGDGTDDLAWRNAATGENYLWFMDGATLASSGSIPALSDLDWTVGGTGDYDGDSRADIAWRNGSSGQVYVWLMDGTTLVSHGPTFTLADPSWQIVPSNPPAGALFKTTSSDETQMSFTTSRRGAPKLTKPAHTKRWWQRSKAVKVRTSPPTKHEMTWTVKRGSLDGRT